MLTESEKVNRSLYHLAQAALRSPTALAVKGLEHLRIAVVSVGGVEQGPNKTSRGTSVGVVSRSIPKAVKISATYPSNLRSCSLETSRWCSFRVAPKSCSPIPSDI